jgi:hypothetical protein
MEARVKRRVEAGHRRDKRHEIAQLLGVFEERHGKTHVWRVCDWWSGDDLMWYDNKTGRYDLANGDSGKIRPMNLHLAMQIARGYKEGQFASERQLAKNASVTIIPGQESATWKCLNVFSNEELMAFRRTSGGKCSISAPEFCCANDVDFRYVMTQAMRRKEVSAVGSTMVLRCTQTNMDESYIISDDGEFTESPDSTYARWHTPLGKQLINRRLGDQFMVTLPRTNFEYTLVELTDGIVPELDIRANE